MGFNPAEVEGGLFTAEDRAGAERSASSTEIEDEEACVSRIRDGDERAFKKLFHHYYPQLCSFAVSFVGSYDRARDVVQVVLMRIWKHRDEWHVRSSLKAYLYQAVRNQGLNRTQQEDKRQSVSLDADASVPEPSTTTNPEGITSLRRRLEAVQRAIDQLPERQRSAFTLHRRHGLTYDEIADVMDISPRTVEVHIATALKTLRKIDGRV